MLRIAPAAASLIWLGSIALATAIYMEWLPARALFEAEAPVPSEGPARVTGSRSQEPAASPRVTVAPAGVPPPAVADLTPMPATAPAADASAAPAETTIHAPANVPESSRTIRGSYYSEDSSWAAGW